MPPRKKSDQQAQVSPFDFMKLFVGEQVPDPITFVTDPEYLNRNDLYPRQGTLLKIFFLRDDLFTDYDRAVIDEWIETFKATGNCGISPDVYERIAWLQERGYSWFREVLAVMGRRAGKGYIGALAMAYVLWNYLAKGDPQEYYGIDKSKKIAILIFAGKRQQAKEQLWRDLVNVILEGPCYAKYVSNPQAERLSVFAPSDFIKMKKMAEAGIESGIDPATFEIFPKESTLMAGRGPATAIIGFDEMAHVVASGANRSAEEVYKTATPSLDQFRRDGFIYEPSSPWQMMGQFYENWVNGLKREKVLDEEGNEKEIPSYPNIFFVQLPSWDIYKDWERSHEIPMLPGGEECYPRKKGPIQALDEEMRQLKQANPETFAVEREAHWAHALDAYLNPQKVDQIFTGCWPTEDDRLFQQAQGIPTKTYVAHADPAKVNDRFGFCIGHGEMDPETGLIHCVLDVVHAWDPADESDHMLNYMDIEKELMSFTRAFMPEQFTFDQFNSHSTIQRLQMEVRQANLIKRVQIFEKTATRDHNFRIAENFKAAINMGLVHGPGKGDRWVDIAAQEMKFLQFINGKVDHPDMGPVQSKDIFDAIAHVVYSIVGTQVNQLLAQSLGGPTNAVWQRDSFQPFPKMSAGNDFANSLSGFTAARQGVWAAKEQKNNRRMQTGRRSVRNPFASG